MKNNYCPISVIRGIKKKIKNDLTITENIGYQRRGCGGKEEFKKIKKIEQNGGCQGLKEGP